MTTPIKRRSTEAITTEEPPTITLQWLKESTAATLTRTQVAKLFEIDVRTVTRGVAEGAIPSIKIGRRVMIPRELLLAMLTNAEEPQPARAT